MLLRLPLLRLELDQLLPQCGPVVAEKTQRLVLDALPVAVGPVVGSNTLRRESRVPLPPVVVFSEEEAFC